jgi:hypothetical protein
MYLVNVGFDVFFDNFSGSRIIQGGNLVSIAGCPTKRAMPRLMWSLINSTYLQTMSISICLCFGSSMAAGLASNRHVGGLHLFSCTAVAI